jgi:hypothetical protein
MTNVTDLVERIELLFSDKPDKRKKKEYKEWNGWHAGRHANATTTLIEKPLDNKRLFLSSFSQEHGHK